MKLDKFGKTALVLAGGGITGAVYEIGALRAIDDLLIDRSVNDFDVYVGTSAGALVSALLVNGYTPETMLKVLDGSHPDIAPLKRAHFFGVNYRDWLRWSGRLPKRLLRTWSSYLFHRDDMSLFDFIWSLSEALPAGLYDTLALERFLRQTMVKAGGINDFRPLEKELYIIATELDSGERAVFGKGYKADTPISLAVAASTALPVLYKPVNIDSREYVDGGLRGNASLDLAIESGATLIVCINPMVPFDRSLVEPSTKKKASPIYLSDKGIRLVADQSLRITGHSGLQYHVKQLRRRHPEVDIILIEPRPTDREMFFYNMMHYSARLIVARFGFESVTLGLEKDYPMYKEVLARHNIPISRRRVIEELAEISQSKQSTKVVKRVLEDRPAISRGNQRNPMVCQLQRTLNELEHTLDMLETH